MTVTTIEKTSAPEYTPGYDEALFAGVLERSGSDLIKQKREAFFDKYAHIPNPTPRHEEWRRTDPRWIPFDELQPLQTTGAEPAGEVEWGEHFGAVIRIGAHGVHIDIRDAALTEQGVILTTLDEAACSHPDLVETYLYGEAVDEQADKYEALNGACWNAGVFLHVPDNVKVERPILLHVESVDGGRILMPRLVAHTGSLSEVSLVEHFVSITEDPFMCVAAKECYVDDGAVMKICTVQEWNHMSCHLANEWALVAGNGRIDWMTANMGSRLSKLRFGSNVAGAGASAELDGIFFADHNQHLDQKTLQVHSSPHTYSRLLYKGAVKDEGRSVYQGLIVAKPGAIDVDAYQTNNNLVLTDGARADSIPGLLIDADDLKCSHGATIGNLDEEQIFYLRSRGIDLEEARRVVLTGFFEEIIQRIPFDFIREKLQGMIVVKMEER